MIINILKSIKGWELAVGSGVDLVPAKGLERSKPALGPERESCRLLPDLPLLASGKGPPLVLPIRKREVQAGSESICQMCRKYSAPATQHFDYAALPPPPFGAGRGIPSNDDIIQGPPHYIILAELPYLNSSRRELANQGKA